MRIRMSNKIKTIFDYISVSSSRITLSITIFNITYILVMYWVGSCNGGAGSVQAHKFFCLFFLLLFGCPTDNFGTLSRKQPHSPDVNDLRFTYSTRWSPGAS